MDDRQSKVMTRSDTIKKLQAELEGKQGVIDHYWQGMKTFKDGYYKLMEENNKLKEENKMLHKNMRSMAKDIGRHRSFIDIVLYGPEDDDQPEEERGPNQLNPM